MKNTTVTFSLRDAVQGSEVLRSLRLTNFVTDEHELLDLEDWQVEDIEEALQGLEFELTQTA